MTLEGPTTATGTPLKGYLVEIEKARTASAVQGPSAPGVPQSVASSMESVAQSTSFSELDAEVLHAHHYQQEKDA